MGFMGRILEIDNFYRGYIIFVYFFFAISDLVRWNLLKDKRALWEIQ